MKAAVFFAGLAAGAVLFSASLTTMTARADTIKTENVTVVTSAPPTASRGVNVPYRTRDEIRSYIAAHPFSTEDSVTYSRSPDLSSPYTDSGALTYEPVQNGLNALNVMRYIAGLSEVTLNSDYSALCQDAAYICMLNDGIDHYPARPDGVSADIFERGSATCARSNLAAGYKNIAVSVLEYMDDSDERNIADLGHRRWCLNPPMLQTGFGAAEDTRTEYGTFQTMYAFDTSRGNTGITGVCWPAQNMPIQFFDSDQAWSWSLGSKIADVSAVSVTLDRKSDGKVWRFSNSESDGRFFVNNEGYGQYGCVIFLPDGIGEYKSGDTFGVRIDGAGVPVNYTVSFFSADVPISAVTGLTASQSSNSLTLSWNGVAAADRYQVDICRNGVWSYLARTASTSYTVVGLAPNTTYQFRVYAFRGNEYSTSVSLSVTTEASAKPAAVTGFKAVPYTNSITLSWNNNPTADKYQIEVYRNGSWECIKRTTGTSYTASGLKPNTSYRFRIFAFKGDEYSPSTGITATTGAAEKPTAVTGFKASPSANSVTLSWNNNPTADKYQIEVYRNGSWEFLKQTTGTSYTASGLVTGNSYRFRIFAFKGELYSSSVSLTATTAAASAEKPSAVTGFKAASTANSITLSWNSAPSADSYQIDVYKNGKWTYLTKTVDTSYTMTRLSPNTSYKFRIYAFKGDQHSSSVSVTASTNSGVKPAPVTNFTATPASATSIKLTWSKSANADSYQLEVFKNGKWTYLTKTSDTAYTATGLTSGVDYQFRIFAFNGNLFSDSMRLEASTTPDAVTGLVAAPSHQSVRLSWKASEGADSYQIDRYENGRWVYVGTTTSTSYTVSGLSSGYLYNFRVYAYKGSAHSASVSASAFAL